MTPFLSVGRQAPRMVLGCYWLIPPASLRSGKAISSTSVIQPLPLPAFGTLGLHQAMDAEVAVSAIPDFDSPANGLAEFSPANIASNFCHVRSSRGSRGRWSKCVSSRGIFMHTRRPVLRCRPIVSGFWGSGIWQKPEFLLETGLLASWASFGKRFSQETITKSRQTT